MIRGCFLFSIIPSTKNYYFLSPVFIFLIFCNASVNPSYCQIPKASLQLWLKADSGVESNTNGILSWKDLSGNGFDASCNTPLNPQFLQNQINGLPAVRFNGKNTGFVTPPFSTFSNKRGTILIVMKVNDRSLRSSLGAGNVVSTYHGNGVSWQLCATPDGISYYDGEGGVAVAVNHFSPREWGIISLVRSDDSLFEFHRNGRFQNYFSVQDNQPDVNSLKIGHNGLMLFDTDDISEVFNGDIAEIIVYNKALRADELMQVHDYLSRKYNIEKLPRPYYGQWWFYLLIAVFLFLTVMIGLKMAQNKKIKKQLEAMKVQQEIDKERNRISRDMHDELGSGLSKISLIAEYSKQQFNTDEKLANNIQSIADTSRSLVDNMRDLIWVLNSDNSTLEHLISRIYEYCSDYLEELPLKVQFDFPENIVPMIISKEAKRNIFFTVKEALNNSVKHAEAKHISISVKIDEVFLRINISDDGKGFETNKIKSGNGLYNMEQRIKALEGNFSLESNPQTGCTISICLDLSKIQSSHEILL